MTPMLVKTGNTFPQLIPLRDAQRWYRWRGDRSKKVLMNLNTRTPATCTTAIELIVKPWSKKYDM